MLIDYCESCSVRIDPDTGVVNPATNASYCTKCAEKNPALAQLLRERVQAKPAARKSSRRLPAVGAVETQAPPPFPKPATPALPKADMAFYFCEHCGRRVTDTDLELGRAKNKQVKGVYCTDCAKGVNTIAFDAISIKETRRIDAQPEKAPVPIVLHHAGRRKEKKENSSASLWAGISIGLVMFTFIAAFMWDSKPDQSNSQPNSNTAQNKTPSATEKAPPVTPPAQPVTGPVPAEIYAKRAELALAEAMKYNADNPASTNEYRKRLEAVKNEFPSSVAGRSAEELIKKLGEATETSEKPVPSIKAPINQPVTPAKPTETAGGGYFVLLEASTGQPIPGYERLIDEATIQLDRLPGNLTIVFIPEKHVMSVELEFQGRKIWERGSPYSLFGDINGKYSSEKFSKSSSRLIARPFAGPKRQIALPEVSIMLNIK